MKIEKTLDTLGNVLADISVNIQCLCEHAEDLQGIDVRALDDDTVAEVVAIRGHLQRARFDILLERIDDLLARLDSE